MGAMVISGHGFSPISPVTLNCILSSIAEILPPEKMSLTFSGVQSDTRGFVRRKVIIPMMMSQCSLGTHKAMVHFGILNRIVRKHSTEQPDRVGT